MQTKKISLYLLLVLFIAFFFLVFVVILSSCVANEILTIKYVLTYSPAYTNNILSKDIHSYLNCLQTHIIVLSHKLHASMHFAKNAVACVCEYM